MLAGPIVTMMMMRRCLRGRRRQTHLKVLDAFELICALDFQRRVDGLAIGDPLVGRGEFPLDDFLRLGDGVVPTHVRAKQACHEQAASLGERLMLVLLRIVDVGDGRPLD